MTKDFTGQGHFLVRRSTVEQRMKSKIWSTGLANVDCMLEDFDARDLVSWCLEIFDPRTCTICLGGA